jgi:hypothetical protein
VCMRVYMCVCVVCVCVRVYMCVCVSQKLSSHSASVIQITPRVFLCNT